MAKKKKIDPQLQRKFDTAQEALESTLKLLLRKHVPDADKNYPKALVACTGIGLTSAKRYLGMLPEDYNFPALDVLITIAEGFKISVIQLLAGVHDTYPAHGEAHPDPRGGGSNAGIILIN